MLIVSLVAPFNGFGEFLYVFYLLLILVVDLLNDLERSVTLAEYFESLLPVALVGLLVDFHAVVGPLRAFDMEVYLAVLLQTLDSRANVHAFLTADYAADVELLEV